MNEQHIHVHIHQTPSAGGSPGSAGAATDQAIMEALTAMSTKLDAITREVAEQTTVTESAVVFIEGLKAEIAQVRAELSSVGVDNLRLDALAAQLNASQDRLAAALVVNTPAADLPTEPTPPPVETIVAPQPEPAPVPVDPTLPVEPGATIVGDTTTDTNPEVVSE